jgi:hypothetical protein
MVQDLLDKILSISQSPSKIPEATQEDLIFQRFNCPPIVPEDEEDKGIWYVVNKSMDAVFGVENCKQNLQTGKFGIEPVLKYLNQARQHPLWNADSLLFLKLEHIYTFFEGTCFQFIFHSYSQLAEMMTAP